MQALTQRIRELTQEMVRIDSSTSYGQRELGEFLVKTLSETDYIKKHPDSLQEIPVDMPGNPFSLLALYRSPRSIRESIVLCGHIDTVGIGEFGPRPEIAFDLTKLPVWLASRFPSDEELRADIESGEFLPGRGSLDMKGGVALLVRLFDRLTASGRFPWNLVLLLTCDEEGDSSGMRAAVPYLARLHQDHELDFKLLINADYISPLTPEDASAYMYTGTIGKLLIGLSVFGTPTHAGVPFEGVNAAALAGAVISHLEGNQKLTQHVKGEFTPPPTALSLNARQPAYSVMTPARAQAYLNVFFVHSNFEDYFREVVNEVRRACRLHFTALRRRYRRFVAKTDMEISEKLTKPEVITYRELAKRAAPALGAARMVVRTKSRASAAKQPHKESSETEETPQSQSKEADPREQALDAVAGAMEMVRRSRPTVVVSVLPPLYPGYAMALDPQAQGILTELHAFARDWQGAFALRHRNFYPYVSDMSLVQAPSTEKLKVLLQQMPLLSALGLKFLQQRLTIPVVNLGPWGKGAHTARERVHLGFLTKELPRMYLALLSRLTGGELVV